MRKEHFLDPTEILRFRNLRAARMEAIFKTIFYGFQIVYGMYWCVWPNDYICALSPLKVLFAHSNSISPLQDGVVHCRLRKESKGRQEELKSRQDDALLAFLFRSFEGICIDSFCATWSAKRPGGCSGKRVRHNRDRISSSWTRKPSRSLIRNLEPIA